MSFVERSHKSEGSNWKPAATNRPASAETTLFQHVKAQNEVSEHIDFKASADVADPVLEETIEIVADRAQNKDNAYEKLCAEYREVTGRSPDTGVKKYLANKLGAIKKLKFSVKSEYCTSAIYLSRTCVVVPLKYILMLSNSIPAQMLAPTSSIFTAFISTMISVQAAISLSSSIKNSRKHKQWMQGARPNVLMKPLDHLEDIEKDLRLKHPEWNAAKVDKEARNLMKKATKIRGKQLEKAYPKFSKEEISALVRNGNVKEKIENFIGERKKVAVESEKKIQSEHPDWDGAKVKETVNKTEAKMATLRSALSALETKKHAMERKFFRLHTASAGAKLGINVVSSAATSLLSVIELAGVGSPSPVVLMIPMMVNFSKWSVFMGVNLYMYARYRPNITKTLLKGVGFQKIFVRIPANFMKFYYYLERSEKKLAKKDRKLEDINYAIRFAQSIEETGYSKEAIKTIQKLADRKFPNVKSAEDAKFLQVALEDRKKQLEDSSLKLRGRVHAQSLENLKWAKRIDDLQDRILFAGSRDFAKEVKSLDDPLDMMAKVIVKDGVDEKTKTLLQERFGFNMTALEERINQLDEVQIDKGGKVKNFFRSVAGIKDLAVKESHEIVEARRLRDIAAENLSRASDPSALLEAEVQYKSAQQLTDNLMQQQVRKELERFFGMREKELIEFIKSQNTLLAEAA